MHISNFQRTYEGVRERYKSNIGLAQINLDLNVEREQANFWMSQFNASGRKDQRLLADVYSFMITIFCLKAREYELKGRLPDMEKELEFAEIFHKRVNKI